MLFAVICDDKPGEIDLRTETRATHRAFLDASEAVVEAGPLLDAAGEMCGSLIVIEATDQAAAEAWAAKDPYALAGLFARTQVRSWNRVIG